MKVLIKKDWEEIELSVLMVKYELDKENIPVDIQFFVTEQQFEEMHSKGILEGNFSEAVANSSTMDICYKYGIDIFDTKCYWCLFARLPEFTVKEASIVLFQ